MAKEVTLAEVYERLHAAYIALGKPPDEGGFCACTLETARHSIMMLQYCVVAQMEDESLDD